MYDLRHATVSDFPAIRALIHQAGINPTGLDWRRFVVAVDESDRVIGCGQVKSHGDGTRELASIAVRPEYRQQGIARAIIEHLLAENNPPLYLMCRAPLQPFYERFGFRVVPPEQMPPYFRRIWRVFGLLRRITRWSEGPCVMVRQE